MRALRGNRQQGRMSHRVPRQRTAHALLEPLAAVVLPELVGILPAGKFWICWGAHEFGNVVCCLYYVNRMKNDLNYEEFIDLCRTVIKHTLV